MTKEFILKHFEKRNPQLGNGLDVIHLTEDGPLFGYERNQSVLVNTTLHPKNGNLVILNNHENYEVYRFETARGEPTLWPGNKKLTQNELNTLYVIVRDGDSNRPKIDISTYLVS